jgi:hypothetical protein
MFLGSSQCKCCLRTQQLCDAMRVLVRNSSGYQLVLVLLFSGPILQDHFGGIGLSLRCKCRDEYIKATFKSCWKGAQQKWILVDMHIEPPWVNKLMFPPAIKDQRKEPPMTDRLAALVRRVDELRQAGLEACHCAEEFYLRRIRPLGRRKTLAFESPPAGRS